MDEMSNKLKSQSKSKLLKIEHKLEALEKKCSLGSKCEQRQNGSELYHKSGR